MATAWELLLQPWPMWQAQGTVKHDYIPLQSGTTHSWDRWITYAVPNFNYPTKKCLHDNLVYLPPVVLSSCV